MTIKSVTIKAIFILAAAAFCAAITSNFTQYRTASDFAKGDPNGVVIDSRGNFYLNRESQTLAESLDDVWTINSIVKRGDDIFIGTSPNAAIYKITDDKVEKIYQSPKPPEPQEQPQQEPYSSEQEPGEDDNDQDQEDTPQMPEPQAQQQLAQFSNEHIFAIDFDAKGRLIAAISGENPRIISFNSDFSDSEVIFELEEANFIFAMEVSEQGKIYLATGPNGKIYEISADLKEKSLLYDCNDRNIISIKLSGNILYAGSDRRGVVYKINTDSGEGTIIYDSRQTDITALEVDDKGNVYAAATLSTDQRRAPGGMPANFQHLPTEGRAEPPNQQEEKKAYSESEGGLRLSIAATRPSGEQRHPEPPRPEQQDALKSAVYRISPEGIVSTLTQDSGIFLDMKLVGDELLIASGNRARLISLELGSRVKSVVYDDPKSMQITSLAKAADALLVGLSNPSKLLELGKNYSQSGYWQSDMIDSSQPARWGKLQIDADVPEGCEVAFSVRSGNVGDGDDPSISDWSEPKVIDGAMELGAAVTRFAQVRIILNSCGEKSPTVRAVSLASVVPNIAPVIQGIKIAPKTEDAPAGIVNINVSASDENNDPLVYKYEIKEIGRNRWIEVEEKSRQNTYNWNTLTVPDGIYEIKITVSDILGNSPQTALTADWVSEPVIVDNTAPVIKDGKVKVDGDTATITFTAEDEFSVIDRVRYTVNSSDDWHNMLPDDLIYDTKRESFTLVLEDLEAGEHIVAVEVMDAMFNKRYERFVVEIK